VRMHGHLAVGFLLVFLRCIVQMPAVIHGMTCQPGMVLDVPVGVYRKWRGMEYLSRIVQHGTCFGRPYLLFSDQDRVTPRGTKDEIAAVRKAQPYYYMGCVCTKDNLVRVPPAEEIKKIQREAGNRPALVESKDKQLSLPGIELGPECGGCAAAKARKQAALVLQVKRETGRKVDLDAMTLLERHKYVVGLRNKAVANPTGCPNRLSRLTAWQRRLELELSRQSEMV